MRKDPVEFRTQIARRRKKFFALILGVALGVMPTVTVMAKDWKMAPDVNDDISEKAPFDARYLKPVLETETVEADDTLNWDLYTKVYEVEQNGDPKLNGDGSKVYKKVSGDLAVVYYDTEGTKQDFNPSDVSHDVSNNQLKVRNIGIQNLDHYKAKVEYRKFDVNPDGQGGVSGITENDLMEDSDWKFDATQHVKKVIVRLYAVTEYNVRFDPNYPKDVTAPQERRNHKTEGHRLTEAIMNKISEMFIQEMGSDKYDFAGFYTEPENGKGEKITKDYEFNQNDTIVYAHWDRRYNVTFHSNYPDKSKEKTELKTTKNGKIESFPKFTFEGYSLEGFSKTKDGAVIPKDTVFTEDTSLYAIWKKGDKPDDPDKGSGGHDDDDDDEVVKKDDKPAYYDPFALNGHYYVNNVIDGGAVLARSQQGPAAMAAFMNALPAGWKMAFPFVISTGGKNDYSLKNGTIKLEVPSGNQGKGREFAIMAIDKNGLVTVIYDTDKIENHITVSPNVEGYAYMLIYKD